MDADASTTNPPSSKVRAIVSNTGSNRSVVFRRAGNGDVALAAVIA
jgi:hypothetical protein